MWVSCQQTAVGTNGCPGCRCQAQGSPQSVSRRSAVAAVRARGRAASLCRARSGQQSSCWEATPSRERWLHAASFFKSYVRSVVSAFNSSVWYLGQVEKRAKSWYYQFYAFCYCCRFFPPPFLVVCPEWQEYIVRWLNKKKHSWVLYETISTEGCPSHQLPHSAASDVSECSAGRKHLQDGLFCSLLS